MASEKKNKKLATFFAQESPVTQMLWFTGDLVILSFLWFLTSIPVITIGTSTSALYYAVVKSLRCKRGTPVKEYFHAWKDNLLKGCILTVLMLLGVFALYSCRTMLGFSVQEQVAAETITAQAGESALGLYVICGAAMIGVGILFIYAFPVLSRFNLSSIKILLIAFVMSIRYFYYTILLAVILSALVLLAVRLPVSMLFVPGVWALMASRFIEKAMKKYLPEPLEGEDAWWLEV
ncbi:MAG: YesL family protein [Lachnospiraceae bacterium]|nr:YesL family protein [Lachnospiraceae bacterium]